MSPSAKHLRARAARGALPQILTFYPPCETCAGAQSEKLTGFRGQLTRYAALGGKSSRRCEVSAPNSKDSFALFARKIPSISALAVIPHSAAISRSQPQNAGSSRIDVGWPLMIILLG